MDLIIALCMVAIFVITPLKLQNFLANFCYFDGRSGAESQQLCISIYVVTGISVLIAFASWILHCFTCCFTRLGFFVEAVCETLQAVLWCIAYGIWQTSAKAEPEGPAEFIASYEEVSDWRSIVLNLGWVIVILNVIQAFIATARFVSACCCDDAVQEDNKI